VKTAFVTGGTGYIGINLVNELTRLGWSVTCIHRTGSDLRYLRRLPVELRAGNLHDAGSLCRAIPRGVDVVFHAAADTSSWSRRNAEQTATNVLGTRNVVNAARECGARRLVLTSTASAYGKQTGPVSESSPSTAANSWINYERSKWLSEEEVRRGIASGLSAVIMNPFAVFGPYDTSTWGKVFRTIGNGGLAVLPPGTLPINHVTEVARAHIAAAERGRDGENYILNGESWPVAKILREMARLMGIELGAPVLPAFMFKAVARVAATVAGLTGKEPDMTPEMADILCRDNRVVTDKAERELDYRRVPVEQCLRDSYEWLKAEGLL